MLRQRHLRYQTWALLHRNRSSRQAGHPIQRSKSFGWREWWLLVLWWPVGPFRTCENENKKIVQVMCAKKGRTGRVGSYWTKSAFRPNKYRPCRRQNMAHRLLFVSDGLAKEADKGNIRSFTAQIQCFFGQCSHCLSLVPKTGATPSFVGLDLSFVASYGDAVLLDGPDHLPGDSLSNLTVAPLAARAYRLSRRHFFELLDDQRPSKAFLIAWSRSFRLQADNLGQDFLCT